jgi:acyl-CoA thioester hydrolase
MRPKPLVPEILDGDQRYVRDRQGGLVWHRCKSRILYADTDRSQVVYHGNYLRYFELGRATLMRDAAYPYREVEESGFVYPIIEVGLSCGSTRIPRILSGFACALTTSSPIARQTR